MNSYELLQKQASLIDEPYATAVRWSKGERLAALNEAAIRLNRDLKLLYAYGTDSTVANQQEYNLPKVQDSMGADFEDMISVVWNPMVNNILLEAKSPKDFELFYTQYGTPYYYVIIPREQKIRFYRIPDTSAQATTLNGALNATATTVTVASTTGFSGVGSFKVDSEVISYTATTATTFTGCTRGTEGTTAATHLTAAAVTWRNLKYCYLVKPSRFVRVHNTGTVVATNASTTVTGTGTNWTNNVLAGDKFGVDIFSSSTQPAMPARFYEIDTVATSIGLTLKEAFKEATIGTTSAMYGIGQPSPFPEAYDEALLDFSSHLLLMKDDDPKAIPMLQKYKEFCQQRVQDTIPANWLPTSGKMPVDHGRISLFGLPAGYPNA